MVIMNVTLSKEELEMLSKMVGFEISDEKDIHEAIKIIYEVTM